MKDKRYERIELAVFSVMVAGMSVAGYVYEIKKDTVSEPALVCAIIFYFLIWGLAYHLTMRWFAKR